MKSPVQLSPPSRCWLEYIKLMLIAYILGLNKDIPLNKCRTAFSSFETLGIETAQTSPSVRELLADVVFLCS